MASHLGRGFNLSHFFQVKTVIIGVIVLLLVWFSAALALNQRQVFLPGKTSDGHILFEASCNSCHEGFKPVSNETCMRCHEAEMADDAHGSKKFRDPRWAADLEKLAVLTCTTCHQEHVHMFGRGVHLKPDLCMTCHEGIIQGELQSHNGFSPDGCWTAGCHNFHDHRSISTGFLRSNLDQPPMLPKPMPPELTITTTLESPPAPDLEQEFLGGK
ncbi:MULTISPECIES: cytochrome c3 family protein [unclassified Coleofasciculus]|uniref:cytochrome c3 family protein n=1 Tax=unclassified Coleofasciculus TaxID=2692782 RepID=UPI00187EE778|nr:MULTISPECIES: cytochrome c3 family protein [unclassified Coleofasciculus]MBE9128651.1 cytochrome c3 family protein [Coleofasciculus sp. LEGE 07081]MBE9149754.1 cytochrome c3 family protein [Coleofasciculus sp. LEGE 07092]